MFFPPRADCYQCLASNMEWFEVTGTGKLVTYSKLQFAPIGFGDDLPYAIALLDYGDYKVFGSIAGDVAEEDSAGRHGDEDRGQHAAQRPAQLRLRKSLNLIRRDCRHE